MWLSCSCNVRTGSCQVWPRTSLRRDKARYLEGTFPHPPRLEPDLRLSPHPAQHFQVYLSLCSVA